jgi:hypothetical protein
MNKKGFIFSLTAIYYGTVFLIFLSTLLFSAKYLLDINSQEHMYYSKVAYVYDNPSGSTSYVDYGWCAIYFGYDAESSDVGVQSDIEINKFCENYER